MTEKQTLSAEHWLTLCADFDNGADMDNHYMVRARLRAAIACYEARAAHTLEKKQCAKSSQSNPAPGL